MASVVHHAEPDVSRDGMFPLQYFFRYADVHGVVSERIPSGLRRIIGGQTSFDPEPGQADLAYS